MSSKFELRPGEAVLFRGDVSNVKSLTNILEGQGVVTNLRCIFRWKGHQFEAERSELQAVEERKHGWASKLEVRHTNGQTVTLQSPNMKGLTQALNALIGKVSVEDAQRQPDKSSAKNTWAWVAAFGPLLSGIIVLMIAGMLGWNLDNASGWALFKLVLFRWFLVYFFLRLDHIMLQRQGFDPEGLNIVPPERFWAYLSSRAKAFGHGRGYVITWWVLVAFDLLSVLVSL